MIPKREWDAYNRSVDRICSRADSSAVRAVLAAVRAGELSGMGVAEIRDQVRAVLEPVMTAYAEAASELAAEWYDMEAEGHGYKLPAAVTQVDPCGDAVDATVRYQIRKLMDGDAEGFARACGALARDSAVRQLNSTIMANTARDRGRGVRFARVTTGRENCPFCIMLAGRGAVYHSRETAGALSHYHRNCDCKIVPSFGDDPMGVLVEGHDPKRMHDIWRIIEDSRRGSVRIDTSDRSEREGQFAIELSRLWGEQKRIGDVGGYRGLYAAYIKSLVPDNPIDVEDWCKVEPKELWEAVVLAETGHSVVLRNPESHLHADGNTSDAVVDGCLTDFKRIESSVIAKMVTRITEKLDRQGPSFLVDISGGKIPVSAAEARIAKLVEAGDVRSVFLLSRSTLQEIKKPEDCPGSSPRLSQAV